MEIPHLVAARTAVRVLPRLSRAKPPNLDEAGAIIQAELGVDLTHELALLLILEFAALGATLAGSLAAMTGHTVEEVCAVLEQSDKR